MAEALLAALRQAMRERDLDYYWVPMSDEYLSEYVPEHAKRLQALSGFSGSAGNLLIGLEEAWIFVDGRYHVQVDQEVDSALFKIEKLGLEGVADVLGRMVECCGEAQPSFGLDSFVVPFALLQRSAERVAQAGGALEAISPNLVDLVWSERPRPRAGAIEVLSEEVCGASVAERVAATRAALAGRGAGATVVQRLDQIAWLLNRRGSDIDFNPVFEASLIVLPEALELFVKEAHQGAFASEPGLSIFSLDALPGRLSGHARARPSLCWSIDPERLSFGVARILADHEELRILEGTDVMEELKAVKNAAEIEGMRRAGRRASAAKLRALCWLEGQHSSGVTVSERDFCEVLERCYAERPEYRGLSFSIIAAAGAHSAIVHYGTPAADALLEEGALFLVDSGAHYLGGTTDATRTILIGARASAEQRRIYTLVLKAHIACASQRFPAGTTGAQLDALTRAPLWREGLDYLHGTGHGVGAQLNVHEGPMGIGLPARGAMTGLPLRAGQVLSIEPGIYHEGWGGVRIENLYLVTAAGRDRLGRELLAFSPLTWIPFDERLIDASLLTAAESAWIDAYHEAVRSTLLGASDDAEALVSEDERRLLERLSGNSVAAPS